MNKKEISEIKRNISATNDAMCIKKVANALVWDDGTVKLYQEKNFNNTDEREQQLYCGTAKKVFSGKTGKNLLEYKLADGWDEDDFDSIEGKLYAVSRGNVSDEPLKDYISSVASSLKYPFGYLITALFCTYSVPYDKKSVSSKRSNDEDEDYSPEEFTFTVFAFSALDHEENRLIFSDDKKDITARSLNDITFKKTPFSGFMYPVFNNRSCDVNNVLYYVNNSTEPSKDFVQEIFGCEMTIPPMKQKIKFEEIMLNTFGSSIDFEFLTNMQGHLAAQVALNHKDKETATPTTDLSLDDFNKIMKQCGAKEEQIETFTEKYEEAFGKTEKLSVESIIDENKFVTTSSGLKIDTASENYNNIKIKTIDGVKCIVIEIDDTVKVNGFVTNV